MPNQTPQWQNISHRKQSQRLASIPTEWLLPKTPLSTTTTTTKTTVKTNLIDIPRTSGILTAKELDITENYDATELVSLLATGRLKSVDVTRAFCKRAAVVHQVTNCLTEVFFERALLRAQDLDNHYKTHSKPIGPLHGLPISLKDTFAIAGHDMSIGIATLCFSPAKSNSSLVDLLLAAGAVLYCKTNVPQTLMALDSHNNVFGRTLNPWNTLLTAGGSSGGEGALVAMRGSVLGVGTDVGGSIRIPALCEGLFGLKPSHGRVPYSGQEGAMPAGADAIGVRASAGPIATSVRDLDMFMRAVGAMKGWKGDVEVIPQSWEQQSGLPSRRGNGKLRVGVVRTDGVTEPMPPVSDFLSLAVDELGKSERVELVEMDISALFSRCQKLFNAITGTDGGNHVMDLLEATGEPLSPWLQGRVKRGERASLVKLRDLHAQKARLQAEFTKIWTPNGGYWTEGEGAGQDDLDVIICPVAPHTVPPIDGWNTASYTSSLVLMDYPAATLPVRQVRAADLKGDIGGTVGGSWDKANRRLWEETDKGVWLGGWHCLQVFGRRREERVVVEAMAVLDKALEGLRDGKTAAEKARL